MEDALRSRRSAEVRTALALAIRERTRLLASDVSAVLPRVADAEVLQHTARLLVDLIAAAVERGDLAPEASEISELQGLCPGTFSVRQLFDAVYRGERIILDELALDESLGATSEAWPLVAHCVRLASLELQTAYTERLSGAGVAGGVRDPLTTLILRPVLDLALENEADRAHRYRSPISLILFDIDNLSQINDEHGYGVGDRVLERLGILARRFFRTYDWVARHGDDSVAALLPLTTVDDAASLADRFRETIQQRLVFGEHRTGSAASVTVSAAAVGTDSLQTEIHPAHMIEEAEAAMMRAKLNGRNRTERVALFPTSLTLLGAATLLDCSPTVVRRLVRQGHLQATRRGRHYHIDRTSIERVRQSTVLSRH